MTEEEKAEETSRVILENLCDAVEDNTNKPGVDFLCKKGVFEFGAEVTCIKTQTVTNQSKIPHIALNSPSSGRYDMITRQIRSKAIKKVEQLSKCRCARLLIIVSYHSAANVLLEARAAELLLTNEQGIAYPPPFKDNDGKEFYPYTDCDDPLFFELREGVLDVKRESISAIWLVAAKFQNTRQITGILNPQPIYDFEYKLFPSVPFVRMKKWPIENNTIETEWIRNTPDWIQNCEPAIWLFEQSPAFQQCCWDAKSEKEKDYWKKEAIRFHNDIMQKTRGPLNVTAKNVR